MQCLNLYSVQGRLLRSDLIKVCKVLNGKSAIAPETLFILNPSARRGHPLKLFVPRSNLDIRKRSFAVRVIGEWNSLSTQTVVANTIETFKGRLHEDLGPRLYEYL